MPSDGSLGGINQPSHHRTRRVRVRARTFLRDRGIRARFVSSGCTGSLVLGAAGLLKGRRATTHWSVVDRLGQFGAIPVHQRVVEDGNFALLVEMKAKPGKEAEIEAFLEKEASLVRAEPGTL